MSPEYFKRELRPREAEAFIEGAAMRRRDGWEQARWLLEPYRSEDSKPVVFPWEAKRTNEDDERTEEDDERAEEELRTWATKVAEMMNKKNEQGDSSETAT